MIKELHLVFRTRTTMNFDQYAFKEAHITLGTFHVLSCSLKMKTVLQVVRTKLVTCYCVIGRNVIFFSCKFLKDICYNCMLGDHVYFT